MSSIVEPTGLGVSKSAHQKLVELEEYGYFRQMADAYRFAISLSLAMGVEPPEIGGERKNTFGVATIDPDREIYTAIKILMPVGDIPIYKWAERLAEWGILEMSRRADEGKLNISEILAESKKLI